MLKAEKKTKHEESGRKERTRQKSQQPGGSGDIVPYKQEAGERKERLKRRNSRGGGGDFSANTTMPPKIYK